MEGRQINSGFLLDYLLEKSDLKWITNFQLGRTLHPVVMCGLLRNPHFNFVQESALKFQFSIQRSPICWRKSPFSSASGIFHSRNVIYTAATLLN
jgi:hypothetical protein